MNNSILEPRLVSPLAPSIPSTELFRSEEIGEDRARIHEQLLRLYPNAVPIIEGQRRGYEWLMMIGNERNEGPNLLPSVTVSMDSYEAGSYDNKWYEWDNSYGEHRDALSDQSAARGDACEN